MSEPTPETTGSAPRRRRASASEERGPLFNRAFMWSFAACLLPTLVGSLLVPFGSGESFWFGLIGTACVIALVFVTSMVALATNHRDVGVGMLLGSCTAGGIGFTLCSGGFFLF